MADVEIREFRPEDARPTYEHLAEWETEVFGEPEVSREGFSNLLAITDASYAAETANGLVGSAHVRGEGVDVLVRKSERRRGIGRRLLRAAEDGAQADLLRLVGVTLEPAAAPFAIANGYEQASEIWLMGLNLADGRAAPVWPDGVSVRTFREDDAVALKELLDAAYAEEPHNIALSMDDWRTFMLGDPSYDPDVWFLAEAGEQIVGAALNWKEGYVKDLVVHSHYRRRGLGEALMRHTFRAFHRRGVDRVTLKTDSINPTEAWRLYERLGMKVERTYEVFEKRL